MEKGYVLYDKASGRPIGSGDMPDRHGYHSQNYIDMYSSTVNTEATTNIMMIKGFYKFLFPGHKRILQSFQGHRRMPYLPS